MSEMQTSTNSPLPREEAEQSSDSSQTWQSSPLEELWEKDVSQMDQATLREHLMRLRDAASSPMKQKQLLKDESIAIATKRAPVRKRIEISTDLY
jgi:hypothetical protein